MAIHTITHQTALDMLNKGALLVDVRSLAEVSQQAYAHDNALHIPLNEIIARHIELPNDKDLILACQAGGRSLSAASYLESVGFNRVHNLLGGMSIWAAQGMPVCQGYTNQAAACCETTCATACSTSNKSCCA